MKSFFIIYPGLPAPKDFVPQYTPPLLTLQDLWDASRKVGPSLLFRVRSASGQPGSPFGEGEYMESCVGLVDSATRWRCVFRMAGTALAGIRNPALAKACGDGMQFVSTQHPAGVPQSVRRQFGEGIMTAAQGDGVNGFEVRVAQGVASLCMIDNDIEAAHMLPFVGAFMPFDETEQAEQVAARMATIETVSGAVLLAEASARLAERAPIWMYAPMPAPTFAEPARKGIRSDDQDDDSGGL